MITNELEFIEGINKRNNAYMEQLFEKYYSVLCSYCSRLLGKHEGEEDLVQNVFIGLWKGVRKFSSSKELNNYLYRACYNNVLVFLRNKKAHNAVALNEINESETYAIDSYYMILQNEVTRLVHEYIDTLPEMQSKVIRLLLEGYSVEEIALHLDISVNTVKTHRLRSFKALRDKIDTRFLALLFCHTDL